ncbi:PucC family protein, partial [Methylorubrum extorquens]
TALAASHLAAGLALAVLSFLLVGMGAGAAGTSLLVLLATGVEAGRRGAAATIVWVMMIAGFAVTAPLAGHFLDPFSGARLVAVSGTVSLVAFAVAVLAVTGIEPRRPEAAGRAETKPPFRAVLAQVLAEPAARRFTLFIFVSMLAYSAQELILEPYAGLVFAMTPGATTKLAGLQHGGVLAGMLFVAGFTVFIGGPVLGSLKLWTAVGCGLSALALGTIAAGGPIGPDFPLRAAVAGLGFGNGVYAVAAIGSMMALAGRGGEAERGTRMGVWGAAQGVAFGAGGFLGTLAVDLARLVASEPVYAYAAVFAAEGVLFLVALLISLRVEHVTVGRRHNPLTETASFQLNSGFEAR